MRILLAITKSNWGGAQEYVFQQAVRLSETCEVAVALGQNTFTAERTLTSELERVGIPTFTLDSLERSVSITADLRTVAELRGILREFRPDVLHLNSSKMCVIGGIAGKLARTPKVVFSAHGFPFFEDRSATSKIALEALTRFGILFTDDVITLSPVEHTHALSWPEAAKKVHLVPNGVASFTLLDRLEARAELSAMIQKLDPAAPELAERDLVIGSIAELHPNKNIQTTVHAIADLRQRRPDIALRYVHLGTGEEETTLQQLVEEHSLQSVAHFVGFRSEARSLLHGFDVFVLPSKKEGLPYVILEAGAAGLPVVASAVGGIPSILSDGCGELLDDPTDSSSLSMLLERMVESQEHRTELGNALKERVETKFAIGTMVAETRRIYGADTQ